MPAELCRFNTRRNNAYPRLLLLMTLKLRKPLVHGSPLLEKFVRGLCPLRILEGLQDLVLCVHHERPILRYLQFFAFKDV